MKILHKGHGEYWFGKRIVLQTKEDFICLQIYVFGRWMTIFSQILNAPCYFSGGECLTKKEILNIKNSELLKKLNCG